jgi:hypothetical protein
MIFGESGFMRSILTTILSVILTLACTSSGFTGPSKKVGDGRRPSEGGEGVGGYLRDPNDVRYERSENKVIVAGDAGAIASDSGKVDGLEICLIGVAEETLRQILAQDRSLSGEGVQVLARSNSAGDGSFKIVGDLTGFSTGDFITLDVTGFCATDRIPLKNASKSIVFKNPDDKGGFSEASSFVGGGAEESASNANGQIFCKDPSECEIQLSLKIVGSDIGDALKDITIEAYDSICTSELIAEDNCDRLDIISLEGTQKIGFGSGNYHFKFSSPGHESVILKSSDDLTAVITLQAL